MWSVRNLDLYVETRAQRGRRRSRERRRSGDVSSGVISGGVVSGGDVSSRVVCGGDVSGGVVCGGVMSGRRGRVAWGCWRASGRNRSGTASRRKKAKPDDENDGE